MLPVRPVLLSLALVLLLVPAASAQLGGVASCTRQCYPKDADVNGPDIRTGDEPVQVLLYPHFDGIQRAPLNTQIPPLGAADENRGGFITPAIVTPGDELHYESERFVWWSTPGFVAYDAEGRAAGTHQEQGLADDVQIVGDQVTLYFYLSAHQVPNGNDESQPALGVMPGVAIHARIETGRHPFHPNATLIAEGDTGTDPASRVNVVTLPTTNDRVYEFVVPLAVKSPVIPQIPDEIKGGYIVTVVIYQVRADDWSHEATQSDWRVRTGDLFVPRLVVGVQEPLQTTYAWMNTFNQKLYLRWSLMSDFGSYDIDVGSIRLDLVGPQGPVDPGIVVFNHLKYGFDHDAHFKPANQTWGLDYRSVPLPDGDYVATGRARNLQGTYEITHAWTFTVHGGVPQVESFGGGGPSSGVAASRGDGDGGLLPSPGGLTVALAAAASAVLLRRRPPNP